MSEANLRVFAKHKHTNLKVFWKHIHVFQTNVILHVLGPRPKLTCLKHVATEHVFFQTVVALSILESTIVGDVYAQTRNPTSQARVIHMVEACSRQEL